MKRASIKQASKKTPNAARIRDHDKTRAHILDVAFGEIYRHGFQGVSVDDIVKKTNLTKGAFYHHFPTKMELGYALVDDVIKPMVIDRWISPLVTQKNPLNGILKQMQIHIVDMPSEKLRHGCPLNNLVQEMAPLDRVFKSKLSAALNLWINETEKLLKCAQDEGHLKKSVKTRQLAQFVVMAHEGFFGMLKGTDDPTAADGLYSSMKNYFDELRA